MKKLSTAITAFLICAVVFASTTQFDQARTECVEPHEHCSEGLACDELCQEELGGQNFTTQKISFFSSFFLKTYWYCTYCGSHIWVYGRAKPGPTYPSMCGWFRRDHHWVRDWR